VSVASTGAAGDVWNHPPSHPSSHVFRGSSSFSWDSAFSNPGSSLPLAAAFPCRAGMRRTMIPSFPRNFTREYRV